MVFRDDPSVDALVRSVAQGAGWQFDPAGVDMSGENYVKTGFEHKVDELHEEELRLKRVVPIPPHLAEAVHGVGVVDKDHSNFEKVRVVHNYSENDDWSVNSATDIPEQKWQSAADAMAFLRPRYYMIKACQGTVLVLWFGTRIAEVSKEMALDAGRKANVTAKKQDAFSRSGVMLKSSVRFTGKDLMEVVASFSKTNQFSEREHKVLFRTWMSTTR
ncbi:hypothetical protein CYMTET_23319 [Cymbomonas tetramitiformis]|uniref:Uncharacterized protein n=1 Tax=Cymbomonas tetramitiformis TaxID=36881 RepID=A0AAE0FYR5_9CHLO|nr:hypothetical protein CYMTET_23319 [Cymbomonas tetramitiformis]